jgi:hypothetical protein
MGHAGSDPSRVFTRLGVRNSTFHQYLMARGTVALRASSVRRRGQSNRLVERYLRGGLQSAVMKAHLCRARRLPLGVQPKFPELRRSDGSASEEAVHRLLARLGSLAGCPSGDKRDMGHAYDKCREYPQRRGLAEGAL